MEVLDLSTVTPDFESYTKALEDNLKKRDSWTDLSSDATGETLIHFNAAVGTLDQWSIEKGVKESFLQLADRDSSVYAGTRMLGVRISRKIPGALKSDLQRLNMVNLPITEGLTVPEYTQFNINSSLPFFNRNYLNFVNAANELSGVTLHQGKVYTKTFISTGLEFQQFLLPAINPMSISDSDVLVIVDGVKWETITDGLWNYGISDLVVSDSTLGSGDVLLQFGNGSNGAIPRDGAIIVITYVETLGSKQPLIGGGRDIVSATQISGYNIIGSTVKESTINLTAVGLNYSEVILSSISDPLAKAYLPTGKTWSSEFVGLQLESSNGLALIIGVSANVANLSVITSFVDKTLPSGSWFLSTPITGLDEKPSSYYKVMAPSLRRANGRAVSPPDHVAIFSSYPGISDVSIKTEKDLSRITRINKTSAVIAREIANNVYNGIDYYEIINTPHPALHNTIWVSLLTSTGLPLTTEEKNEILAWFSKPQFTGSTIKFLDPTKTPVNLYLNLKCFTKVNAEATKNLASALLSSIFSTNKPMLSKRIRVSDLNTALTKGLSEYLDSWEILNLVSIDGNTYTTSPLTDSLLTPTAEVMDNYGLPLAPSYLYLNNLIINSVLTDR